LLSRPNVAFDDERLDHNRQVFRRIDQLPFARRWRFSSYP
jgi:hypothetical protein